MGNWHRKLGSAAILLVTSCGGSPNIPGEEAASTSQAASAWDFTMWPRVSDVYPISVCFRQSQVSGGTPTPDWSGDKAIVESDMLGTWGMYSAVDYLFQGNCPSGVVPSDWLPIELIYDSTHADSGGGLSADGVGARNPDCFDCQIHLVYGANRVDFDAFVVHEAGHALGLRHERSRADFPGCLNLETNTWYPTPPAPETGPLLTQHWDIESIMAQWECYATRLHGIGVNRA